MDEPRVYAMARARGLSLRGRFSHPDELSEDELARERAGAAAEGRIFLGRFSHHDDDGWEVTVREGDGPPRVLFGPAPLEECERWLDS
jgi:hypothetical protein